MNWLFWFHPSEAIDVEDPENEVERVRQYNRTALRSLLHLITGIVAAFVLMYMGLLSLQEGVSLRTEVIVGMLGLIVLLLYGVDPLIALIDAWRGD